MFALRRLKCRKKLCKRLKARKLGATTPKSLQTPCKLFFYTIHADVLSFTRLIHLPAEIPALSGDPEDDIVLVCAVVAKANYIVSGDKRHLLPLKAYQQIQIISPTVFLSYL